MQQKYYVPMNRKIFIDSTNIKEIKKWNTRNICYGVTTNQKLFVSEKTQNFKKTIIEICQVAPVPVSVELTTHQSPSLMVQEAKKFAFWHKNIVVKVPMTTDGMGLEVLYKLKKLHIKTNATIMVTFEQLLLACLAGATYVSIFFNRSKDAGYDPIEIIKRTRNFIDTGNFKTQIIAGSIRKPQDVGDAFAAGADIVTITPKVLDEMLSESMTQKTIEEFDSAWKEFEGK